MPGTRQGRRPGTRSGIRPGDKTGENAGRSGRREGHRSEMRPGSERECRGMLREVVVDTETTGLDHASGDRVIEIGCVEIINRIPTGREFHRYFNPERDVHEEALAVHGL